MTARTVCVSVAAGKPTTNILIVTGYLL